MKWLGRFRLPATSARLEIYDAENPPRMFGGFLAKPAQAIPPTGKIWKKFRNILCSFNDHSHDHLAPRKKFGSIFQHDAHYDGYIVLVILKNAQKIEGMSEGIKNLGVVIWVAYEVAQAFSPACDFCEARNLRCQKPSENVRRVFGQASPGNTADRKNLKKIQEHALFI